MFLQRIRESARLAGVESRLIRLLGDHLVLVTHPVRGFIKWRDFIMMVDLLVPQTIYSLLVCVLVSSGLGCSNWSNENIDLSKQLGDKIVEAISQYQLENSTYPNSLTELVPEQLNEIEGPIAGTGKWRYQPRKAGGGFTLSFGSKGGYPNCYYDSELGDWIDDR